MTGIDLIVFGVVCVAVGHTIAVVRESHKTQRAMEYLAMHSITCQFILMERIGNESATKVIEETMNRPEWDIPDEQVKDLIKLARNMS